MPITVNITPENYHSLEVKKAWMSHSQWKSWLECPARTKAELAGTWMREPTEAMVVGSYVDRALTYPDQFEAFVEANRPEIFDSKGKKYAAFQNADTMIERVQADPVWNRLMKIGKTQEILTGSIADMPWLYMADLLCDAEGAEMVLDLKTAADFEDGWTRDEHGKNVKVHWIDAAGYWRQLAVGRRLFEESHGITPVCGIVGVKKPSKLGRPSGVGLWIMEDSARLEAEIERIKALTPKVRAWKEGTERAPKCGVCDYCFSVSTLDDEKVAPSGRAWTE